MGEWQPIETAPGDGTAFLAVATVVNNETGKIWQEQHVVWIDSESGAIADEAYQGWDAADYTHWMPLPAPPGELAALRAEVAKMRGEG